MLFLKYTYFQFSQMLTYTSLSGYITNECIINPWRQLPAVCVYEQNEMPTNCGGNKIGRPSCIHDFVFKRALKRVGLHKTNTDTLNINNVPEAIQL